MTGGFEHTGLDGVYRRVGKGPTCAANQPDDHVLVGR